MALTKRRNYCLIMIILLQIICIILPIPHIDAQTKDYYRIVLLSDVHLPYSLLNIKDARKIDGIMAAKAKAVDDINSWNDVNEVVVLGDMVAEFGSVSEYQYAHKFLARINKPVSYLVGNHEYLYADPDALKLFRRGTQESQRQKLERFKETFGVKDLYYSKKVGSYFLIYLATDKIGTKFDTELSTAQLEWFTRQLAENHHAPTIVFFHGPLKSTLENYNAAVNTPRDIAQPEQQIDEILHSNPQVFMWVSGHTHTGATNPSFNSKVNYYEGRVLNVHNSDWERDPIYTNSLYLYPDKVVIKTFNHKTAKWMDSLERVIPLPIH